MEIEIMNESERFSVVGRSLLVLMPFVPRIGEHLWFYDATKVSDDGENKNEFRYVVTDVAYYIGLGNDYDSVVVYVKMDK